MSIGRAGLHRESFPFRSSSARAASFPPAQFDSEPPSMCPLCESTTGFPVMAVKTCDTCKEKAKLELQAFNRGMRYPINYSSGLLYMRKL